MSGGFTTTEPHRCYAYHAASGPAEPAQYEIITLRYIADLELKEIAEVCGLGLSATKMRLYRATERLRELAELDDE